ncbi:MAG: hypothetical protein KF857_12050 [Fimbriimonadaceae bacterium]|nr:hypothetical protein [Fimbriimonadaceae bacterium]
MKRSREVPAKLVAAMGAALLAAGCGSGSTRVCESRLGVRRPDSECVANGGGPTAEPHWVYHRSSSSRVGGYFPVFGGSRGTAGAGPSTAPSASPSSAPRSGGVTRGGFGGSASGWGGFGG